MRLLLASNNRRKRDELRGLLAPLAVDVVGPSEVGGVAPVDEDRDTFEGNAAKKARAAAREHRTWALADDSGLEVDALDGAPGVRSARFAGADGAGDAANNAKLLHELAGVPAEERGARFVCALALADPSGEIRAEIRGTVRGTILEAPRGAGGFGYDPLFLFTEAGLPGAGRTFAELAGEEKAAVSHRGRALRALAERLSEILAAGTRS